MLSGGFVLVIPAQVEERFNGRIENGFLFNTRREHLDLVDHRAAFFGFDKIDDIIHKGSNVLYSREQWFCE